MSRRAAPKANSPEARSAEGSPVNRLSAVLHLAARLADSPAVGAAAIDVLPAPVMDALALKYGWLVANFPTMPQVPLTRV